MDNSYKNRFQNRENRSKLFTNAITDNIRKITAREFDENSDKDGIVFMSNLEDALNPKNSVEPNLIVEFIFKLSSVITNIRQVKKFRELLDIAEEAFVSVKIPRTRFLLAKARVMGLERVGSKEREQLFLEALKQAENTEEQVIALIGIGHYYNDNSKYKQSITFFEEAYAKAKYLTNSLDFQAECLIWIGASYYTMLNFDSAFRYVTQGREMSIASNNPRQLSSALHYLARIEHAQGKLLDSLKHHIEGLSTLEKCPYEPGATAFYHLRIAQVLIAAGLTEQAIDHLRESEERFFIEESFSSGLLQNRLEFARVKFAQGNYAEAVNDIEDTIDNIKNRGFPRGQLLCYVILFWIHLKKWQFPKAVITFFRAISTWKSHELGAGGGSGLFLRYLKSVLLIPINRVRKKTHGVLAGDVIEQKGQKILTCICNLHNYSLTSTVN